MLKDIKSMTREEIEADFKELGVPSFRGKQVYEWLQKGVASFSEMTNLPKDFRAKLSKEYRILSAKIVKKQVSQIDPTAKYLLSLYDGELIECVLMEYRHGKTLCISSQVGCKMGCTFCATGKSGFSRDLFASEMLAQIETVEGEIGERISNIVMMGMGEPLDNYENVVRFLRLVSSDEGRNLGMRHISLSTCGIVPRIYDLAKERFPLTLSVSLHAPNDEIRAKTMPVARAYPIGELIKACNAYFVATKRRISFEYAMIEGVNDSPRCAKELAQLLRGMLAHVNLIPVNDVTGTGYQKSTRIHEFQQLLEKSGITATVRRTLGSDIDAACGQLRRRHLENEGGAKEPMQVYQRTETGYCRTMNQDCCDQGTFPDGAVWMIVCDGMGGANAGNVASLVAARKVREYLLSNYENAKNPAQIETMLSDAVDAANEAVYELAGSDPSYDGMGTTIVAAVIKDRCAYLIHVGDSRAYRVGPQFAEKLTVDHSMVEELVMLGQLTEEEARVHPKRNIITRAIGVRDEVDAEYDFTPLEAGDILLLCTDGLSNTLNEETMFALRAGKTLKEYADALVENALQDGGYDNITVSAAEI